MLLLACVALSQAWAQEAVPNCPKDGIYSGDGITLYLGADGFFALKSADSRKKSRSSTGLWHMAQDSLTLILSNYQDREIKLTVGKNAIYGNFGTPESRALYPAPIDSERFQINGILYGKVLTDAASGMKFEVVPEIDAQDGMFATAEISVTAAGIEAGRILKHSGKVPRFYQPASIKTGEEVFKAEVENRFWRLPQLQGLPGSALEFKISRKKGDSGYVGEFVASGPGLRLEGNYVLSGGKLTLSAPRSSLHNLEIIGASALARLLLGEFDWKLSPRGLELSGPDQTLLLGGE